MKIERREFLQKSALGVGAMLLGSRVPALAEAKAEVKATRYFDPFESVAFGQTPLKMSRICMGTGVKASNRQSALTRLGKDKCEALLRSAYDRGVRMFDVADLYGTHPYVLPALKGIPRDNYRIVSKLWWRPGNLPEPDRPNADVVIPRFLKELGTDHIDVLLLHCVTSDKWPEELRRQMDILSGFKQKGIIRALGVSCHSLDALQAAADEPWVECVHARINPDGVHMDGTPDQVVAVLRKLKANGKAVTGMKLIGEGKWRDDAEKRAESIRFVLGLGCVDVLNVGFENEAQIDDLAGIVSKTARPQI